MKLIDKHLLREFIAPAFYCLFTFTMVFLIADLFNDLNKIVETKPPVHIIVGYYLAALAPVFQFLMPSSLMLASLYTLYTLTRNNELTAMRASGLSIYRIMIPFLLVGVVLSLAAGVAQETVIPRAVEWSQELKENRFVEATHKISKDAFYFNSTDFRQWHVDMFDVKNPTVLHGVEVKQETPEGQKDYIIIAERADHLDGVWWFTNARIQDFGTNDNPIGGPQPIRARPDSTVEMRELTETPGAFANSERRWDFLSRKEMREFLRSHPRLSEKEAARISYQIHSRAAMPWACFIVMLFAVPTGARTGRQGALTAVFAAIGLLAGFYLVNWVGQILGSTQLAEPWVAAWLSNMVFLMVGLFMWSRIR